MRTEKEMYDVIVKVAEQDERIRAVTLEGSRTNPNVPRDIFQDYDISYLVTELESFTNDHSWVDIFGERIIMQTPEDMTMFPAELGRRFSYLMLFEDGNRIDLTLIPLEEMEKYVKEDKLLKVLLDKDQALPELSAATDQDYWVKQPSEAFFQDCCNEFWWVSTYVAKGLWRKEMLYAQDHLYMYVRKMLMKMLEWRVGLETNFSLSIGKNGKYVEQYLSTEEWQQLLATFPKGSYTEVWQALFSMISLFRATALQVADKLDYTYDHQQDQLVSAYLKQVEQLPADATTI